MVGRGVLLPPKSMICETFYSNVAMYGHFIILQFHSFILSLRGVLKLDHKSNIEEIIWMSHVYGTDECVCVYLDKPNVLIWMKNGLLEGTCPLCEQNKSSVLMLDHEYFWQNQNHICTLSVV